MTEKMMLFFWVMSLCRLVGRDQRFGEKTYCLFQGCRERQQNVHRKCWQIVLHPEDQNRQGNFPLGLYSWHCWCMKVRDLNDLTCPYIVVQLLLFIFPIHNIHNLVANDVQAPCFTSVLPNNFWNNNFIFFVSLRIFSVVNKYDLDIAACP